MSVTILPERPDTPDAIALINELEDVLSVLYPAESRHGFSVQKLIDQNVAFFVGRKEGRPAACGGVKLFGTDFGEVKRMYVRPEFRGLGFARKMLDRIAAHAKQHSVQTLRLETGIHQIEAIGLYRSYGFTEIGPFDEYKPDPLSLFFEMNLA